jgi:pimeloyl-ACP methyl ester carboxylesterase
MKQLVLAFAVALAACGGGSSAPKAPIVAATKPTAFSVQVSGAGRPVIFIPGFACAGSVWDATVAHLGGKVQAHVLTLAGFAGQPAPADKTAVLPVVHEQLVEYIRANKLDKPIIVGHSMGGFLALWLASTNSADIGGVIDVDGLPFFASVMDPKATEASVAASAKEQGDKMAAMTQEQFAAQTKGFLGAMITDPATAERVVAEAGKSDPQTSGVAFREMIGKDLRPGLANITTKVTVVAATNQGPDVTREGLEAAWHAQVDAIKGVEIKFVENARHFVMLDQPEAFFAIVDAALAR